MLIGKKKNPQALIIALVFPSLKTLLKWIKKQKQILEIFSPFSCPLFSFTSKAITKQSSGIYIYIYMEARKMILMNISAGPDTETGLVNG